jgi:uncharacterized protein (TIGR00369 family)
MTETPATNGNRESSTESQVPNRESRPVNPESRVPFPRSSKFCFACGVGNECGLHMKIVPTEDGCRAIFTPVRRHEGFANMTHGGIVATLLDEVIAWACTLQGYNAVTAELTVRYKRPVPIDKPVEVVGRIIREHGRLVLGESAIHDEAGELLASASAKMMR